MVIFVNQISQKMFQMFTIQRLFDTGLNVIRVEPEVDVFSIRTYLWSLIYSVFNVATDAGRIDEAVITLDDLALLVHEKLDEAPAYVVVAQTFVKEWTSREKGLLGCRAIFLQ